MQKINKKYIYLVVIIIILISIVVSYIVFFGEKEHGKFSVENANNELRYSQTMAEDINTKPFISNLPIENGRYTILYSSVKQKIVVIFKNQIAPLEDLISEYSKEIYGKLEEIGVPNYKESIIWDVEK